MPRDEQAGASAESGQTPDFELVDAEDEENLSVEDQLEREAERLVSKAEPAQSKRSPDSVRSERGPQDDKDLSARERQILELAEARAENRALRERLSSIEQKLQAEPETTEEDIDALVGDIDESLEGIRPTLKRMGQSQVERDRALERKVDELNVRIQTRIDQLEAATVKQAMKIDKAEEAELIQWARQNERIYTNAEELEKIVLDFREKKELEELRAQREERARQKAPERQANTRQRQSTRSLTNDIEDLKGMDPFTKSWNRAVREKLSDLKAGRFTD